MRVYKESAGRRSSYEPGQPLEPNDRILVRGRDQLPVALRESDDLEVVEALHDLVPASETDDPALVETIKELTEHGFRGEKPGPTSMRGGTYDPIALYYAGQDGPHPVIRLRQQHETITGVDREKLFEVNYFRGSGIDRGLQRPELAAPIRELDRQGYQFYSWAGSKDDTSELHAYDMVTRSSASPLWLGKDGLRFPVDGRILVAGEEAIEKRRHTSAAAMQLFPAERQSESADYLLEVFSDDPRHQPLDKGRALSRLLEPRQNFEETRQSYLVLADEFENLEEGTEAFLKLRQGDFDPAQAREAVAWLAVEIGGESAAERATLLASIGQDQPDTNRRLAEYIEAAAVTFGADPEKARHHLTSRLLLKGSQKPAEDLEFDFEEDAIWIGDTYVDTGRP